MSEKPTILLHWSLDGSFHYLAAGDVRILCVDERSSERIYETDGGVGLDVIESIISGEFRDPIDAVNAKENGS